MEKQKAGAVPPYNEEIDIIFDFILIFWSNKRHASLLHVLI